MFDLDVTLGAVEFVDLAGGVEDAVNAFVLEVRVLKRGVNKDSAGGEGGVVTSILLQVER